MQGWTTEAVVLKRVNVGEADRVITLLTPDSGKLVGVAKGIRKPNSGQAAYFEPGNHIVLSIHQTKSLPIFAQSRLVNQFSAAKTKLQRLKQVFEILELADLLFVEDNQDVEAFDSIIRILERLDTDHISLSDIQERLNQLLIHLGYQDWHQTAHRSILDYASSLVERPVRSYDFLSVEKKDMVK